MSTGFLQQLRDRQVFKTLVLYGAIAWGFYEIAKEYLEQFGFPAYAPRLLLIFLTLGLPAAVFLAWYFDVDRRAIHQEQRLKRANWYVIAASLALPVVGSVIAFPYVATPAAPTAGASVIARDSVAVMPFSNLTDDQSLEFLADGVAEEVIAALSRLDSIGVSARSLSFLYRDASIDDSRVGRELNVAYIVRGSIQTSGDKLRLRAYLIDTKSGHSLWSQTADISVAEVFEGQEKISQGVAAALATEIGFELPATAGQAHVPDPAAYNLYLRGRHTWHQRGNLPMAIAVQSLAEAVRIDPGFARGWAALASAYLTWPSYSREGYATWQLAEDAAKHAVALDPTLAEPYAVLSIFAERRNEWIEADRLYREAIARDDKNATTHYWYGEHLSKSGRYTDSVKHMQRAIELDPVYLPPQSDFAFSVLHFRDYKGAADRFRAVWDKGLRSLTAWQGNFVSSMLLQDPELAHGWVEAGPLPEPGKAMLHRLVAVKLEGASDPQLLRELLDAPGSEYRFLMWATASLGDLKSTFEIANDRLDKGLLLDVRPLWNPAFDTLRARPEFIDLMHRLGYIDYWEAVGWGDVCRRRDDKLVCDSAALTPERLQEILAGESIGRGK